MWVKQPDKTARSQTERTNVRRPKSTRDSGRQNVQVFPHVPEGIFPVIAT
jgi:hypothetical protein